MIILWIHTVWCWHGNRIPVSAVNDWVQTYVYCKVSRTSIAVQNVHWNFFLISNTRITFFSNRESSSAGQKKSILISSDDEDKSDEKAKKKKSDEDRKKKAEKKKSSVGKSSSDAHAFLDISTSEDEDNKTAKTPKSPPTAKKPKIRYKSDTISHNVDFNSWNHY